MYARPSSRSSAVATPSRDRPSWTIAKATSGWMPTTTALAPRSLAVYAIDRRVRVAKESRTSPCLRMGTDTGSGPFRRRTRTRLGREHAVPQNPLGVFESPLEVADGVQLRELDAERDERLGDFRAEAGHDHVGAHEPRCGHRLQQVIRHLRVDRRHPRDVHDDDLRAVRAYRAKQALGDEPRALGVDDADDREQQQALADLEHRRRELPDGLLLLPDG